MQKRIYNKEDEKAAAANLAALKASKAAKGGSQEDVEDDTAESETESES